MYVDKEAPGGPTVARRLRSALPAEEALAFIAGDDPRPLLVLRECRECNGTDRALLSRGADNERTMLLARWFHCVKLPMDVREEDHPFFNLFPSKDAEHLFVASRDGSIRVPLESETSRVELWKAMTRVLDAEYQKRPDAAVKRIARLLDQFDVLDDRRLALAERRDEIFVREGQNSRRLAKVLKELADVESQIEKLSEELAKASELELKRPKVEPAVGSTAAAPDQAG